MAGSAFLGLISSVVVEEWWKKNLSSAMAFLAIAALLLIIMVMSSASIGLLRQIRERGGIQVDYYPADETGRVFSEARDVVAQATTSIHVLNSYLVEEKDKWNSPGERKAREEYYATILDRVRNHKVDYKRLLQVDKSHRYLKNLQRMEEDSTLRAHLEAMCRLPTEIQPNSSLQHCEPTRLTNFVVVDGVRLIWQIHEVTRDGKGQERLSLEGAFIFYDPEKRITKHFENYFKRMLSNSKGALEWKEDGQLHPKRS